MTMLSIAFLGCGAITRKHSKTLQKVAHSVSRHYASRDGEKAARFSRELDGKGSFGSYKEAIESADVDTVFICTPPDLHLPLAITALQAGKHVIVEKPPFLTLADMDLAIAASEKARRQLIVAENYFYKPLRNVLRDLLVDGVVGRPLLIQINALKKQLTSDWRDDPATVGRGALYEGGIHWINFLANLGPEITQISATRTDDGNGLDRSSLVMVKYVGGMAGTLAYSWEVPSLFKGLRISRIFGTEGSITFETNGLFVIVHGRRNRVILPGLSDISGFKAMLTDFVRSLEAGQEPLFSARAARRDMRLIEEAYRSMQNQSAQQSHT
ncbi:MAG: Gfo/Idh/MocA family oxidoreductase [Rhodothermales bacterium]